MDDLISRQAAIDALGEQGLITAMIVVDHVPSSAQSEVKKTERGWPGHFIGCHNCLFRRNTLLEYGTRKWVVSTVGAFYIFGKFETIGADRWYETRVFEVLPGEYNDADVYKEIEVASDWGIWGETIEHAIKRYGCLDIAANNMHERIVAEMLKKIQEAR